MTDADLIQKYGGPTKLAQILGFEGRGQSQRVSNWVRRGIPARVKLDFPALFVVPMSPARRDVAAIGLGSQPPQIHEVDE